MKTIVLTLSISCLLFSFHSRPTPALPDTDDAVCLSAEEMKLYNLLMRYRKSKRLPPIPLSAKLTQVAQAHTHDLQEHFEVKEGNPCNPHSWSEHGSWTPCCYTPDHQQAACMWNKPKEIAGYNGNGFEIAYYSPGGANAQEGLNSWKGSAGHNAVIVNSTIWQKMKWKAIGISIHGAYGVVWFGEQTDDVKPSLCE